jgi:aminoglycoside 6'-N-acetyltransferase
MTDRDVIGFRALRRRDFDLLARWLAEPLVARWWNHETTPDAVERDFGQSVDGHDATELFVALLAGRPFGLIQRYPIAAYAEYLEEVARVCPVPPGALSVDYLIGEPDLRGRGLGAAMISAFVAASWASCRGAAAILVPVAVGNIASWRALERAGFARIAAGELEPDNPRDGRDHHVYAIRRPAIDDDALSGEIRRDVREAPRADAEPGRP